MKRCMLCCGVSLLLFFQIAWGAADVIKAEVMERRFVLGLSQMVQTQDGELRLAAYKDWVYIQKGKKQDYRKLVPGTCPQWLPRHKGQTDRWFYLFLPVGFDGKSELWIASTDGYYLGKAADGYFRVNSTPVLSPDGKTIVSVYRPLVTAAGNITRISVIRLKPVGNGHDSTQHWVYRADNVVIQHLRFEGNDTVTFKAKSIRGDRAETKRISLKSLQPSSSGDKAAPEK